jgi:ABC-type Fe3+/spermidine/putrescine transport system ATPase subunit
MSSEWVVEGVEANVDHFRLGPVDLTLRSGRTVAVLGTSGAGKTTLLRVLGGFLRARRGRILRDGVDITDWQPEGRSVGYVPQGLGLFPHRTVAGNVRYPLEIRGRPDADRRTAELLAQFRLTSLALRYPSRLSGGEQQRVAIARALAADPGLIAWDEPWQGLDVVARHELGQALHELRETEQIPVIVVTHDPALAFSVADSFLVLHSGQVRAHCDAATLMREPADAFAARFVGFENVFSRGELESSPGPSLRGWLLRRAGAEGVAFASPLVAPTAGGTLPWEGTVRSVRPSPQGVVVEVEADRLAVSLRVPRPVSSEVPTIGERIRFGIDTSAVQPLGDRRAEGTGG